MVTINVQHTNVELQDGRIGKVIGQLESGEFMLARNKWGQITYFKQTDVSNIGIVAKGFSVENAVFCY